MPRGISTLSKQPHAWTSPRGSDKVIYGVVDSYFDLGDWETGLQVVNPYSVEQGSTDVGPPKAPTWRPGRALPRHRGALAVGGMDQRQQCSFMPARPRLQHANAHRAPLRHQQRKGAQVVNISAGMMVGDEGPTPWPVDQQIEEVARRELLAQEDVWKYVRRESTM